MGAHFGPALAQAIKASGLTAYRISKLTGISQPTMTHLQKGTRNASLDTMKALAKVEEIRPHQMNLEYARARDALDEGGFTYDPRDIQLQLPAGSEIEPGSEPAIVPNYNHWVSRSQADQLRTLDVFTEPPYAWGDYPYGDRATQALFTLEATCYADFAIHVTSDVLLDVGFRLGTYLFISKTTIPTSGQPVIARIDGADYLCRIYRDSGKRRWLETRPSAVKDRLYFGEKADIEICGVVVAWWGRT